VLVAAHRIGHAHHEPARLWLDEMRRGPGSFGLSELVLSGFARIVTNPRAFAPASTVDEALGFADVLRQDLRAVHVRPSARHWAVFRDLLIGTQMRGSDVADAYLAALAIDAGCEWITFDRGFSRFPGLRWRSPLDPA